MDLKLKTVPVHVLENGSIDAECPVDGDFLLPDYCPDMAAVLKCTLTPAVLSRRQSGDKMLVDGQSSLRVLYLDEERTRLHTFETVLPFSGSLPCGEQTGGVLPYVTMRVNYLNCRAVSPRRLDVHGALTATRHGGNTRVEQVVEDIAGEGVYTRPQTVCCSIPLGAAEKIFSVCETVDVGAAKPPADTVLRTSAIPMITSVKPLNDKAIVKGCVRLITLYTVRGGEGTTARAEHEFPFSQVLELEGMSEGAQCHTRADVITCDVQMMSDAGGLSSLLSVNVKLCLRLDALKREELHILTDAYTAKHPSTTVTTRMVMETPTGERRDTAVLKEVLDLPSENVADIADMWCEPLSALTRRENGVTYVDGHLQLCMLTRDRNGCVTYYEHTSEYSLQYEDVCDRMTAEIAVCDTACAVVGGKVEVRIELAVLRRCYAVTEQTALQQFEVSSDTYPVGRAALQICRACRGDSVWEIAKSCHTDVRAVMEENGLQEECLTEDGMLLIPLC